MAEPQLLSRALLFEIPDSDRTQKSSRFWGTQQTSLSVTPPSPPSRGGDGSRLETREITYKTQTSHQQAVTWRNLREKGKATIGRRTHEGQKDWQESSPQEVSLSGLWARRNLSWSGTRGRSAPAGQENARATSAHWEHKKEVFGVDRRRAGGMVKWGWEPHLRGHGQFFTSLGLSWRWDRKLLESLEERSDVIQLRC